MAGTLNNVPALTEYINGVYGGKYYTKPSKVSVGTSSTKLVGVNYDRVALIIVLLTATPSYVAPLEDASATNGFEMTGGGSVMAFNVRDDLTLPGESWNAISSSGTVDMYVVEIIKYSEGKGT